MGPTHRCPRSRASVRKANRPGPWGLPRAPWREHSSRDDWQAGRERTVVCVRCECLDRKFDARSLRDTARPISIGKFKNGDGAPTAALPKVCKTSSEDRQAVDAE